MAGVTLPKQCIVGAGSVVTKSFSEEGCIIAGNPARIIGYVDSIRETKRDYIFNFRGMTAYQKKKEILEHPRKYLNK